MKAWTYSPDPRLGLSLTEQLTVFPRTPDPAQSLLRLVWNLSVRLVLRLYFRLRIVGREHLPEKSPFVLVANHSSHLDAVSLLATLPLAAIDRTFAVAARDYFFSSLWRSLFSSVLLNALPFDRKGRKRESLELCADVLRVGGGALIMFPEGSRSPDGRMLPFKRGIGILAAGSDLPVVPAYIGGAHRAWPKGSRFPRPARVVVFLGAPRVFADAPQDEGGHRAVADEVERAVRALAERSGAHRIQPGHRGKTGCSGGGRDDARSLG
jgi:1-acyl-sn-glycerol-3-phosphate acyltransferase